MKICVQRPWAILAKIEGVRRVGRTVGLLLAVLLAISVYGCVLPPYEYVLEANGQSIRLTTITQIVTDPDLSEEQKKERLRNLGIEDEELIELLIGESG